MVVSAVFFVFTFCGDPSSQASTPQEIWAKYKTIYMQYQEHLYQFGAERWPEYEPVLKAQLEYERANLKLRSMKFQYLQKQEPTRLKEATTVQELVHFPWTKADTTKLKKGNPEAKEFIEKVRKRKDAHFNHPKWPELRERFKNLPSGSRYHQIREEFQQNLRELGQKM